MRPETPHLFDVGLDDPDDGFGRYVFGALMLVGGALACAFLLSAPLLVAREATPAWSGAVDAILALLLLGVACPVLACVVTWLHDRRWTTLFTAVGQPDLAPFFRSAAIWLVILTCLAAAAAFSTPDLLWERRSPEMTTLLLGAVPLGLMIFFQVTAEELFFRSYLVQALRRLTGSILILALVSSLIFAALHSQAWDEGMWPARAAYFALGLFMFAVTWRTGRLEAAIGIHFAQNIGAVLIFGALGEGLPSLFEPQEDEPGSLVEALLTAGSIAAAGAVYWFFAFGLGWVAPRREKGSGPAVAEPFSQAQ